MASNAKNVAELLNTDTTVKVADIEDGSITTAKLADGEITTVKLADNAVTTAKLYAENLGRRNLVHNGAMQVDQRHNNASFTVVNGNALTGYIADRFRFNDTSGAAFTGQTVSDAPVGFEYSSKVTVTTADASLGSTEFHRIIQGIEGKDIGHLNWGSANAKTLTLSFYVKSSVAGQYYVSVFNSAANRTLLKGYTISSANTWEKKTITIIGDQSGTWLTTNGCGIYLMWSLGTGSSYQSNTLDAYQAGFFQAKSDQVNIAATNGSTFQLTGVQLEVGSVATDFEHRSYGEELALCQRYFFQEATDPDDIGGKMGIASSVNAITIVHPLPVQMRAKPTVGLTSAALRVGDMISFGTTITSGGTISINGYSGAQSCAYVLGGFSGLTTYRTYLTEPRDSDGATGIVLFHSEL